MLPFEKLDVWKRSSRLCVDLYKSMFDLQDYSFRNQITRAALSVPSNIAEGFERKSEKEKAHFLDYAKGSLGEVRTQLLIGIEIGYINKTDGKVWVQETIELSKMLAVLANKLSDTSG